MRPGLASPRHLFDPLGLALKREDHPAALAGCSESAFLPFGIPLLPTRANILFRLLNTLAVKVEVSSAGEQSKKPGGLLCERRGERARLVHNMTK